jgi:hypothetical protein
MLSYNYNQGALVITFKTSKMVSHSSPNFGAYVEISDAVDPKVKNTVCFGIYRYEDETLNEQILTP